MITSYNTAQIDTSVSNGFRKEERKGMKIIRETTVEGDSNCPHLKSRRKSCFQRVLFLSCVCRPAIVCVEASPIEKLSGESNAGSQSPYQKEPAYESQSWIFETINLFDAWAMGYTGEDVKVRINDEDWEYNHIEWDQPDRMINNNRNAEEDYSCGDPNNRLSESRNSDEPSLDLLNHGAAVTSIVGATGLNGFCGVGIAPRTKLSFCNFRKATDPEVLSYNVTHNRNFYDISVNSFAHEGCTSAPSSVRTSPEEETIAMRMNDRNTPMRETTYRSLQQNQKIEVKVCPFINFFNDEFNRGDDPCSVCTRNDFGLIKRKGSVINPQVVSTETDIGGESSPILSEQCASSVRTYCLRNFRRDQALCTEWIEVINRGKTCQFKTSVGEKETTALEKGAKDGRFGKGVVYIFAAGNSYGNGDNTNFQSYSKSRYVMTVGAVKLKEMVSDEGGGTSLKPIHSSYSTGGSSVFVVAPGGDYDSPFQHVGAGGQDGTGQSCMALGTGTSFAAPVVAGVVALMLEANGFLTWRDVRFIVATTSKPVYNMDDEGNNDDTTFALNGAGIGYSELYGFGLIDAKNAVIMAKEWKSTGQQAPREVSITERSGKVNLEVFDDSSTTTTSTITISQKRSDENFLESVSVYLNLRYVNRGHLRITLTSPSGTVSLLSPGGRTEYTQMLDDEWWEFLTLRSWGETPYGDWKISITDTKPGNGDIACVDRPIAIPEELTELDFAFTCAEYESNEFCLDGEINNDLTSRLELDLYTVLFEDGYGLDGRTAREACCICGGGIKNDDDGFFVGQLREWKIVLGDGSPTIETQRIANFDPFLPEVTTYEFMRCRGEGTYGEKRDCCNGLESICDLRVNEVLYATLYNGLNSFEFGNFVAINPEYEPERALEAGYRAFKLDVCNCGGDHFFCYGTCAKESRRDVIELMMGVKEFLLKNPTEIVIFFFEVKDDIGRPVNLQDFFFLMVQIMGFVSMIYKHSGVDDSWPTLRELTNPAVNQRMIMFHYNGPDCTEDPSACPNKFHSYYDYVIDNNDRTFPDPESIEDRDNSCAMQRSNLTDYNTFVGLSNIAAPPNFEAQGIRVAKRSASRLNQYYAVKDYVDTCSEIIGTNINFVQNDFWGVGELIRYTQDENSARSLGDSYIPPTPSPTEGEATIAPTFFPTFFPTKEAESMEPTATFQPSVSPSSTPTGRPDPCPSFDGDCKGCKKDRDNCLWCVSTNSCYNRFVFENIFDLDDEVIPCAGEDILNSFDTKCQAPPKKVQNSVYDDDFVFEDSADSNETSVEEEIDSESPTRAPADPPSLPPVFVPLSPPTVVESTTNAFSKFFGNANVADSGVTTIRSPVSIFTIAAVVSVLLLFVF